MQLTFSLISWGAWSPDCQHRDAWSAWHAQQESPNNEAIPALAHVPAMQRRRFSRLTRMMLEVAHQACAPDNCRSVFASRHGELNRTIDLLQNIIGDEPLSPMGFSQSVHNTASGLFGIVHQNRAASTSIAAGTETLSQAMVEAYAQLAEDPEPLLLVFGDDPVPPVYDEYTSEYELPLAMGLVLAPAGVTGKPQLTLKNSRELPGMGFGRLLHALATGQDCQGQLSRWDWKLSHA
ncbi:beta-ketoacyl synthase chain length factor [Shewanella sedimentimangrovi]|uniref:Beta-ketoacyl synthase chain length factor n=1 Tax=Shewanella sedimentimangrovi TaxID=2814293 RepID=A0ABX7R2G4_9GAMM|nr:beta-ketoacyl synthase chain length factor [Shewanella sedimentimangrovi]QSX37043.1 beta-ketoacyl synthase chain length factor [Shewanella sedimentimangrovi]